MEINGTSGPDNLEGTSLGDVIDGGPGNDELNGLGGDDVVVGGAGADRVTGGAGQDMLIGGSLSANLIVNGSFETQDGSNSARDYLIAGNASHAGIYHRLAFIYGWQAVDGTYLEINTNKDNPYFNTGDGTVSMDLEPGMTEISGNTWIFQDVGGLTPGSSLVLSFSAARAVTSASTATSTATALMQVWWNDTLIATIAPSTTTMSHYSFVVTAAAVGTGSVGANRLSFREMGGGGDGYGTMLDAVSLKSFAADGEADWAVYDRSLDGGGQGVRVNLGDQAATLGAVLVSAGQARDTHGDTDTLFGIENVVGTDLADFLLGNATANRLEGGAGADWLDGGAGADTLDGGAGDDAYYLDSAQDALIDPLGAGYDRAFAATTYVLTAGAAVEVLALLDAAATTALSLGGNEYGQYIYGNQGDNWLDGGGGADALYGFAGDDNYSVDNPNDRVFEDAGGGYDRLYASTNFALYGGSEIEVMATSTTAAVDLSGNEFGQYIYGNSARNILSGSGGVDAMYGFAGDDVYVVENLNDLVFEAAGGGNDTLIVQGSYALAPGVEIELIVSTPLGHIHLVGNEFDQELRGYSGPSDVIDGGGGADLMSARAGDDWYYVDNAGDVVVEYAGEGIDRVYASAGYALNADTYVEYLMARDSAGIGDLDLTGNELGQYVLGNHGHNHLDGGAGFDWLDGYGGSDYLTGGAGSDQFAFTTALGADNIDSLVDFDSGSDTIILDHAIFTGLVPGSLPAEAFRSGTSAQDADDRVIYDPGSGTLYFDADGTGAASAVQIATLAGAPLMVAGDFVVI